MEKLKFALAYGADAVYLGGKAYGLRAFGGNFSREQLREAVAYAHDMEPRRRVYVTVNIFPHESDLSGLPDYIRFLDSIGVDALLVADIGVFSLVRELVDFLGFKRKHNAFMIGAGSLGAALMQDVGLSQYGLNIVAGFDINPELVGTSICGIPVYSLDELHRRQQQFNVSIAVLAVPVEHAQEAANTAIESGLKAIWNFTPYRIKAPSDIVIQNTSIYAHLALMYYRMEEKKYMNKK